MAGWIETIKGFFAKGGTEQGSASPVADAGGEPISDECRAAVREALSNNTMVAGAMADVQSGGATCPTSVITSRAEFVAAGRKK